MLAIPETVLVVDDDADARRIARAWFENAGCRVLEAVDGRQCLEVARENLPELIVLDLVLPDMDGWEAARALRADPTTAAIPILGLTGLAFPVLRKRAVEAGCDRVLTKPVARTRLVGEAFALYGAMREARAGPPGDE